MNPGVEPKRQDQRQRPRPESPGQLARQRIEDGDALDRALLICAAVDAGRKKPEDARKAFIAAAIEAGLDIKA